MDKASRSQEKPWDKPSSWIKKQALNSVVFQGDFGIFRTDT